MTLIWPWMLLALLLLPLFAAGYVRRHQRRQRQADDLGPLGLYVNQAGRELGARRHGPAAFYFLGLALLLLGLSRPEVPVSLPRMEGTVILAFDVSNSMLADDLEPSRIEAAKNAARAFVADQPATIQIGVVAFSNGGLVVQAPTNQQGDVLAAIDRLSPQSGTSLAQGIFTSLNAIAGQPITLSAEAEELEDALAELPPGALDIEDYSSAVILLLTDGENAGPPEPLDMAQLAAEAGVRVYPVGIGSDEGAVLELDGFHVVTQLDEPVLEAIASLTNGRYYRADDAESLEDVYRSVDLQLTMKGEAMETTAIFAGLGALMLLIGAALSMLWLGRIP